MILRTSSNKLASNVRTKGEPCVVLLEQRYLNIDIGFLKLISRSAYWLYLTSHLMTAP